jgi:hypothetical protein
VFFLDERPIIPEERAFFADKRPFFGHIRLDHRPRTTVLRPSMGLTCSMIDRSWSKNGRSSPMKGHSSATSGPIKPEEQPFFADRSPRATR